MTDDSNYDIFERCYSKNEWQAVDKTDYKSGLALCDESRQVYAELKEHIREGGSDGKVNYWFYGAYNSVEAVYRRAHQVYSKLVKKNDNDEVLAVIKPSCAFESDEPIQGLTITLFYDKNDITEAKFRAIGGHKITYVFSKAKTKVEIEKELVYSLNKYFRIKGNLPLKIVDEA